MSRAAFVADILPQVGWGLFPLRSTGRFLRPRCGNVLRFGILLPTLLQEGAVATLTVPGVSCRVYVSWVVCVLVFGAARKQHTLPRATPARSQSGVDVQQALRCPLHCCTCSCVFLFLPTAGDAGTYAVHGTFDRVVQELRCGLLLGCYLCYWAASGWGALTADSLTEAWHMQPYRLCHNLVGGSRT